ncbi:PWWP domain-containing protein [Zalerion maritima]|uniref:PWWP domain-containing protein n=1 Tax=Zalerion maritima TaxID=339359 RepID=A0AAD5RX43_9PEZI|nr:PWWP domain-containing protein [Zalerion maritima]
MAEEKNATPAAAHAAEQPLREDAAATDDASKNEHVDMKDATPAGKADASAKATDAPTKPSEPTADQSASGTPDGALNTSLQTAVASTPADKSKTARRKSGPVGSIKKKLNKKGSRARILHLDAKPGDHYFVKLKGYPAWPVIVCSEDMLPELLLKTRPVSAAHSDGTYRQDFADGGKRAADRTFPVMYLQTNEFGWVSNQDFHDLDPNTIMDTVGDKMRRDLQEAYTLASEQNPLDHYKELLVRFEQEKEEQAAAKAATAAAKKTKKTKAAADLGDEDMSMPDVTEDEGKARSRKRKAEDDGQAPQRSESVKKPKIKLTSTPKTTNGAPKAGKESVGKAAKAKVAKKGDEKKEEKEEKEAPKELAMTPEERLVRKEKEVLFLRHKLQRGLLTRDQEPKENEMVSMSEFLAKLEGFPDLEVSIIKKTKINKVLKAILKLESIPREEEFNFKPRSQTMLDKWNKLLAADAAAPPAANGVNGTTSVAVDSKAEPPATTNGVAKEGEETEKAEEGSKEDKGTDKAGETNSEAADDGKAKDEEPAKAKVAA